MGIAYEGETEQIKQPSKPVSTWTFEFNIPSEQGVTVGVPTCDSSFLSINAKAINTLYTTKMRNHLSLFVILWTACVLQDT